VNVVLLENWLQSVGEGVGGTDRQAREAASQAEFRPRERRDRTQEVAVRVRLAPSKPPEIGGFLVGESACSGPGARCSDALRCTVKGPASRAIWPSWRRRGSQDVGGMFGDGHAAQGADDARALRRCRARLRPFGRSLGEADDDRHGRRAPRQSTRRAARRGRPSRTTSGRCRAACANAPLAERADREAPRPLEALVATFTGATGLEPATSGVTGRSWRFRFERGQAGKLRPASSARRCGRGGRFRREFAPGWVAKTAVLELLRECFCAPSAQAWAAWPRLRFGQGAR
jgi:hypothetical protein